MSQNIKITSECIRQTVTEKKTSVMEININYPQVKAPEFKMFERHFNEYYTLQMKQFNNYAKTKMLPRAKNIYEKSPDTFQKWGAIANFHIKEDEKFPHTLWIIQRIWIFRDGEKRGTQLNQVWNLADGTVRKGRDDLLDFT